jgi:hypothetical protein
MTDSPNPLEPSEADPFAFIPAPCATNRHDGWTPDRQRQFIAALAVMGSVSRATKAVGISGAAAYKLRKRKGAESFADAWDAALQAGRDRAFDIAMDRAINGITTPRYYRGKIVGTRHHFDHRTIMSALMPPPVSGGARGRR